MVKWALALMIFTAPAYADLTPTAAVSSPAFEPNHPVEDFFTVSLVSIPFTGLWALLGASVVAGISQSKYPPEFSDDMFLGAAGVALGASVGIGLLSVSWGGSKKHE